MKTSSIPITDKREIGNEAAITLSTAKQGNGVQQLRDNNCDTYWQSDGIQPHIISIQFHKRMSILEIGLYLDLKLDESYTPKVIAIKYGTTYHDLELLAEVNIPDPSGWIYINVGQMMQEQENLLSQLLIKSKPHLSISESISATTTTSMKLPLENEGLFSSSAVNVDEKIPENENVKKPSEKKTISLFDDPRDSRHIQYPVLKTSLIQCEVIGMYQNGRDTHVRQLKIWGPKNHSNYFNPSSQ